MHCGKVVIPVEVRLNGGVATHTPVNNLSPMHSKQALLINSLVPKVDSGKKKSSLVLLMGPYRGIVYYVSPGKEFPCTTG